MAKAHAATHAEPAQGERSPSHDSVQAARGDTTTDALPSQPAACAAGQTIAGRYELRELLGRGGFGTVYRGWDKMLERAVAVKLPHADRLDEVASQAQIHEARLAAQLRHPGIVAVHDCGLDAAGRSYVVFEFVPGQNLSQFIAGRPCSSREAARLVAEMASALHAAHKCGLVHRDLKPANILIDQDGRPRIADFGLAVSEQTQRQKKGEFAGTPAYMAPEQLRGEIHHCDGRTDIWALGVIFYELLTGRRPFVGDEDADLVEQILERPVRPPRQLDDSIPRELEQCCLGCLNKQMEQRFPTAIDVAERLQAWLSGDPTVELTAPARARSFNQAAAASAISLPREVTPRGRWQAFVAIALAAALFVVVGRVVWHWSQREPIASGQAAVAPLEPNQWHNLLAKRPRALASAGDEPQLHWDPQQKVLSASAGYPTLIQLGKSTERDYQLRFTFQQRPWNGRVGVFLAHGDDPQDPERSQFKMILLERKNPPPSSDLALFRMLVTQEKTGRQAPISRRRLAQEDVPHPGMSAATLEIEVRGSRLVRVTFAGRDCLPLVDQAGALADQRPCSGPFGLYLDDSSVVVEKAEYRFSH